MDWTRDHSVVVALWFVPVSREQTGLPGSCSVFV